MRAFLLVKLPSFLPPDALGKMSLGCVAKHYALNDGREKRDFGRVRVFVGVWREGRGGGKGVLIEPTLFPSDPC